MESVEPIQINIYQSYAYRKDLSWLHFDNEPRVQERQQLKDQQSHISVLSSLSNISKKQLEARLQIFLEAILAIVIMQESQFYLEEKGNPSILKDYFSSRTDPSIFTSIAPILLDQSDKTS